mmetsp:Transcript_119518/g.283769  ORF Transcript_119518/g.283769 Transcript_119518/m.283769 type:complete len:201 (+) Transcript_119518:877-1479(+)
MWGVEGVHLCAFIRDDGVTGLAAASVALSAERVTVARLLATLLPAVLELVNQTPTGHEFAALGIHGGLHGLLRRNLGLIDSLPSIFMEDIRGDLRRHVLGVVLRVLVSHRVGARGGCCRNRLGLHVGLPLLLLLCHVKPHLDRRRDRRGQDGLFLFWRPRCPKHDRRQSSNIRRHRQRDIGRSGRRCRSRCRGSCKRDCA